MKTNYEKPAEKSLRAFIAVSLADDIKAKLKAIQARMKPFLSHHAIKWVQPDAIHITLKFLGNIQPADVDRIITALDNAIFTERFVLSFADFGCFPSCAKPRVMWVGTESHPALNALHQTIEQRLTVLDFTPEDKPFRPHLTLARVNEKAHFRCTPDEIHEAKTIVREIIHGTEMPVHSVHLFQSRLTSRGAIYSLLHDFKLK